MYFEALSLCSSLLTALQAAQAQAKGIDAVVINEDADKTTALWKKLKTSASIAYVSLEMALSDSFHKLLKIPDFGPASLPLSCLPTWIYRARGAICRMYCDMSVLNV